MGGRLMPHVRELSTSARLSGAMEVDEPQGMVVIRGLAGEHAAENRTRIAALYAPRSRSVGLAAARHFGVALPTHLVTAVTATAVWAAPSKRAARSPWLQRPRLRWLGTWRSGVLRAAHARLLFCCTMCCCARPAHIYLHHVGPGSAGPHLLRDFVPSVYRYAELLQSSDIDESALLDTSTLLVTVSPIHTAGNGQPYPRCW
jgi:hypothetical protein